MPPHPVAGEIALGYHLSNMTKEEKTVPWDYKEEAAGMLGCETLLVDLDLPFHAQPHLTQAGALLALQESSSAKQMAEMMFSTIQEVSEPFQRFPWDWIMGDQPSVQVSDALLRWERIVQHRTERPDDGILVAIVGMWILHTLMDNPLSGMFV